MSQDHATEPTSERNPGIGSPFARGVIEPAGEELDFPPVWARKDELPSFSPLAGFMMQSITGGKLMANWVTIEPNRIMPLHQHPHEQLGVMLEGALELTMAGETRLLRPGDAYAIPPNLPHSAVTYDEGCVVLDVFTPPREDYQSMARGDADNRIKPQNLATGPGPDTKS